MCDVGTRYVWVEILSPPGVRKLGCILSQFVCQGLDSSVQWVKQFRRGGLRNEHGCKAWGPSFLAMTTVNMGLLVYSNCTVMVLEE